jgi:hypothetical protein
MKANATRDVLTVPPPADGFHASITTILAEGKLEKAPRERRRDSASHPFRPLHEHLPPHPSGFGAAQFVKPNLA